MMRGPASDASELLDLAVPVTNVGTVTGDPSVGSPDRAAAGLAVKDNPLGPEDTLRRLALAGAQSQERHVIAWVAGSRPDGVDPGSFDWPLSERFAATGASGNEGDELFPPDGYTFVIGLAVVGVRGGPVDAVRGGDGHTFGARLDHRRGACANAAGQLGDRGGGKPACVAISGSVPVGAQRCSALVSAVTEL